jgi:hypothetical protein
MVVAVSPPVSRLSEGLGAFDRPRLFVTGQYDEAAPPNRLQSWIETLPGGYALRVVPEAQHHFIQHIDVATTLIVRFVERWALARGTA